MAKEELHRKANEIASLPDIDMFDVVATIDHLDKFARIAPFGMIVVSMLCGLAAAIGVFVGVWLIVGFTYIVICWIIRGFTDRTVQNLNQIKE